MKHETGTNQTQQLADVMPIISAREETNAFTNLASILTEVRKLKGVKGYIMRSETEAIVDLTEESSLSEYALLASQICECTPEMVKKFNLTDVESITVEGKTVKVLCINIDDNQINVFMDKTCSHALIIKRIRL